MCEDGNESFNIAYDRIVFVGILYLNSEIRLRTCLCVPTTCM